MRTVLKYPLRREPGQQLELPAGSLPLHIGRDPDGHICAWMLVESEAPQRTYDVKVVGTGQPAPGDEFSYAGQVVDGPFVWHVFFGRPR